MSAPNVDPPPAFFAFLHERIRGRRSPELAGWHFNFAAAFAVLRHPIQAYRCARWLERTTTTKHVQAFAHAQWRREQRRALQERKP